MKTLATVLLLSGSMLAGGAVQADEAFNYPADISVQSTQPSLSRAQVLDQLHAAEAAGQVVIGHQSDYPTAVMSRSSETRAEVKADLAAARDAGQVVGGHVPFYPAGVSSNG